MQEAPAEAPPPPPLSPARAFDETTLVRAGGTNSVARAKALTRGNVVHRLLQSLPDIPRDARDEAARRHLTRTADFSDEEAALIIEQVINVLDEPRFAELFGDGTGVKDIGFEADRGARLIDGGEHGVEGFFTRTPPLKLRSISFCSGRG